MNEFKSYHILLYSLFLNNKFELDKEHEKKLEGDF